MGYKIVGFIVWKGAKWYAGRWATQNKRELALAGASAGALLAGVGAAVAAKRSGDDE